MGVMNRHGDDEQPAGRRFIKAHGMYRTKKRSRGKGTAEVVPHETRPPMTAS
jgi:hypothetical protein